MMKCIVSIDDRKCSRIRLLRLTAQCVQRKHIVDMGLWYNLCFPDNKGPKVKGSVLEQEKCIVAVESIGN